MDLHVAIDLEALASAITDDLAADEIVEFVLQILTELDDPDAYEAVVKELTDT